MIALWGLNARFNALLARVLAYGVRRVLSIPERFLQNACNNKATARLASPVATSCITSS
ncbi:hypothetical protein [Synechococcus sp. MIT S1220]|uniref:hypothetical protein n=1 Tax=Synechococcus sp. MIT S1220 TaxID=3082549 RepID=UPI0039AF22D1